MASLRATNNNTARSRGLISDEGGLGLIEVMVGLVLLLIGVLSAFVAFEVGKRTDVRAERTANVSHRAQAEIERILALPYASVGMESIPGNSGSGNAKDPLNYVINSPAEYKYDWSQPAKHEAFVSGGTLPTSSAWTDGNRTGTLYRFVTWVADPCPSCAHSQDYKRVTLALTTTETAGTTPFVASTIVTK